MVGPIARRLTATVLVGLLVATACGDDGTGAPDDRPLSVVVDYSPTVSDVGALLYLAMHPDVELAAVTLSGTGESPCAAGVSNTAALLARVGHLPVPIACGPETPVGPGNLWPTEWRTASAELQPLDLPATEVPDVDDGAVGLLVDTAAASENLVIVALGPLTNLAHAVSEHPSFVDDVAMTFTMGGAIAVAGNAPNGSAEWNYYVDPTAADVVVRSGLPLTLVPLDATNEVPASRVWWQRLSGASLDPARSAAEMVRDLWATAAPWDLGFSLWDELTAVVALEHRLAQTTTERIRVVTGGPDAGRTVIDAHGTPVRVVAHPDRRGVEDELFERLTAAVAPSPNVSTMRAGIGRNRSAPIAGAPSPAIVSTPGPSTTRPSGRRATMPIASSVRTRRRIVAGARSARRASSRTPSGVSAAATAWSTKKARSTTAIVSGLSCPRPSVRKGPPGRGRSAAPARACRRSRAGGSSRASSRVGQRSRTAR